jgi:hypothetical protein
MQTLYEIASRYNDTREKMRSRTQQETKAVYDCTLENTGQSSVH